MNVPTGPVPANVTAAQIGRYFDVSRESVAKLEAYADLLVRWQATINLVSPASIGRIWQRHIADSLQVADLVGDDWRHIADLGSGAGLPGVPVCIALQGRGLAATVALVESNAKKCAFLREAVRVCEIPARIIDARIESLNDSDPEPDFSLLVSRALAPLDRFLGMVAPMAGHPQRILISRDKM